MHLGGRQDAQVLVLAPCPHPLQPLKPCAVLSLSPYWRTAARGGHLGHQRCDCLHEPILGLAESRGGQAEKRQGEKEKEEAFLGYRTDGGEAAEHCRHYLGGDLGSTTSCGHDSPFHLLQAVL